MGRERLPQSGRSPEGEAVTGGGREVGLGGQPAIVTGPGGQGAPRSGELLGGETGQQSPLMSLGLSVACRQQA